MYMFVDCHVQAIDNTLIKYDEYIIGNWDVDYGGILGYFDKINGQNYSFNRYSLNIGYVSEKFEFVSPGSMNLDVIVTTKDTSISLNCPGHSNRGIILETKLLAHIEGKYQVDSTNLTIKVNLSIGDSLICSDISNFLDNHVFILNKDTYDRIDFDEETCSDFYVPTAILIFQTDSGRVILSSLK